ncbi:hypothetical protein [Brachyspira pilosicoli]|uniref:hypothetical protein n=1 Tax=Brachyspira pilosicoli TaxID=52584 RepID=UPI0012F6A7BC|nr:hypothetical protein [Brachyspira pilosicoli]
MKNKNIFLKIYIVFVIILAISIIVLYVLGKKERIGYLSDFDINVDKTLEINGLDLEETKKLFTIDNKLDNTAITNYIFTNTSITNYNYDFRMKYYSKIFTHSDIYGVYPNLNNLPKYIQSAKMWDNNGTPFGNFVSTKMLNFEKIDNINYVLKVKNIFYINIFALILIYIFIKIKDKIQLFMKKLKIYNTEIKLNISVFLILGYLYLIIPYIIFVLGWTKYYISIPITVFLLITLYLIIKNTISQYNKYYSINLLVFISILLIIIFFITILGIGEIFNQSGDMRNGRNAVFRDLINFSWPIIYPKNGYGFVYYFAHWVVPSLFGKLFGLQIGLFSLILWSSFGILIFFILMINFLNIRDNKYIIISIIIFMFFSPIPSYAGGIFIEYASVAVQIYHLFNQSIAIWIMCTLFLYQKNSSNFAFLGLSVVFYSPYAIIGILPYMFVKLILDIKNNKLIELKNIFSVENILSSISIFPILFLYLSSSDTTNDSFQILITKHNYIRLFINYMFAFGLFAIILYKNNKTNYIFYVSIFVFIFVSMIRYSQDHNFSRTNLTSIFFLAVLIIEYFYKNINIKSIKKNIMIFLLIIGSYNSILYFEQQISLFIDNGVLNDDGIGRKTFNKDTMEWVLRTITCKDIDNSIFFKYIAKDIKQ